MIKQFIAVFFISFNAALGIRKSHGVEQLDQAHKEMFPPRKKKKQKKKFY